MRRRRADIFERELDARDPLACDNRAVALVAPRQPQSVILVTPGNLFLESALRSMPGVQLTVARSWPAEVDRDTILVGHQTPLAGVTNTRKLFVIQPVDDSVLGQLGPPLGDTLVVSQSSSSLLMSHVQLQNVPVPGVRQLAVGDEYQVLAEAPGGVPVFAARTNSDGKVLVWNLSVDEGELPLRTAFPILMSNAIQWFQGEAGPWLRAYAAGTSASIAAAETSPVSSHPTGDPASWRRPEQTSTTATLPPHPTSAASCFLVRPDGTRRPLSSASGPWSIGPLDQCGVWRIERSVPTQERLPTGELPRENLAEVACNLASASESDIRVQLPTNPPVTTAGLPGWPLWCYLTLIGLVLTVIEWFLYQRRWIG